MAFERYTIYWTPDPDSALADFGRRWLGNDLETGTAFEGRERFGIEPELADKATKSPGRYGLHATIKAPFRLAPGVSEETVRDALAAFCAKRRRVRTGRLRLHRFPRYLALIPEDRRAEVDWLAADCVTHFDRFRAPLDEEDRKRRSSTLSPIEQQHLDQFGYHQIFSLFLFHITLAGPLEATELSQVEAALAPVIAPFTQDQFIMDELCLVGDPGGTELFREVERYSFKP